jgi:hypothetical protein
VASTKRSGRQVRKRKKWVPSEEQLARNEKLRDELRHFDLKKFAKEIEKALSSHHVK